MSFTRRILACCWLILLLVLPAAAQFKAAIQGTVTDASGATVSSAKVTVTEVTESASIGISAFSQAERPNVWWNCWLASASSG